MTLTPPTLAAETEAERRPARAPALRDKKRPTFVSFRHSAKAASQISFPARGQGLGQWGEHLADLRKTSGALPSPPLQFLGEQGVAGSSQSGVTLGNLESSVVPARHRRASTRCERKGNQRGRESSSFLPPRGGSFCLLPTCVVWATHLFW